jgi:hypothetical protein
VQSSRQSAPLLAFLLFARVPVFTAPEIVLDGSRSVLLPGYRPLFFDHLLGFPATH